MKRSHRAAAAAVSLIAAATATTATAGPVTGKLELPAQGPARPPLRGKAFLDRIENPHALVRPVDPLPSLVVVLEGGPTGEAPPPAAVTWDLLGDSFARAVMPVRAGGEVMLRNKGRAAPVLVATGRPDIIAKKPINPTAEVSIKVGTTPGAIELVDETTPHLRGRLLVVASPYFAIPDDKGNFTIPDVPAGTWTLRVWYATGWVDRTDDKIEVGTKKVEINPKLPPGLPVKAP